MTSSLVGSEMCIRDRHFYAKDCKPPWNRIWTLHNMALDQAAARRMPYFCLLYTSDAADDM
eukprot:2889659-Prorocentrum_lima.AAC.1